jgi:hypothetical protein
MMALALFLAAAATPADLSAGPGRAVMRDFAECMARNHSREAKELVGIDHSAILSRDQMKLFKSGCLSGTAAASLRGGHALYRFALAEALLHREYRKKLPSDPSLAAPITHPILAANAPMAANWVAWGGLAERWPAFRDKARAFSVVSAFGDCVVRAAPGKAWMLLTTDISSPDEKAAIARLQPAMGSCVPSGAQIELSPNNIRGTIALNYYRLLQAPRAAQGASR